MIPIVTPAEMAAIDEAAPEPVEELIGRAGAAVAAAALAELGGAYGRRIVVLAGKGNNGADGRAAAVRLRRRGARVVEIDAAPAPDRLPQADLVIDAAYGTGLSRPYCSPEQPTCPVLAVDIPSGVDGRTGAVHDRVLDAELTVTFAALKPGLVLHPGAHRCGRIDVADIGLDASRASAHLVTASDVAEWLPRRPRDAHKWQSACWVVGGSPGMTGAARLAVRGAQRVGAGYVRLSVPDGGVPAGVTEETVVVPLEGGTWSDDVLSDLGRISSLVLGPGLGLAEHTRAAVRALVGAAPVPVVVDGDGLTALAGADTVINARTQPTVLTPHDGELARLLDRSPGADRFDDAKGLASSTGAVVLLKGPSTVVADPDGRILVVTEGDQRLATAGTGDVLAGVIGGLLARGGDPFEAAATAAWLHGRAARHGPADGLVASDLPDNLVAVMEQVR